MGVRFTPLAARHLATLSQYIGEHASEKTADAYVSRIVRQCQSLADFPVRGRRRDDILPDLRTVGFERRVTIAFMIENDRVIIEGIFYGGQQLEDKLGEPN